MQKTNDNHVQMKDYIFKLRMAVRDYECDIEGIVNNANYLHYMEHTRHQFLLTKGVSFIELHRRGIDTVVARIKERCLRNLVIIHLQLVII